MDGQYLALSWPYGFRFEWKLKRVFRQAVGPKSDSDEVTLKVQPPAPALDEVLRHISDHVGHQLESTVLSLSNFQNSLGLLQISADTRRIVLQRVLADMAGNEREALLGASSWWRQHALDHGSGYVDAIISHYLYKCMTDDISHAWEESRQDSVLKTEAEELSQRREAILATAPDHIAGRSPEDELNDLSATEAYLVRAEVIRELVIFANNNICTTTPAKQNGKSLSMETLIGDLMLPANDNARWKAQQLEKCKRVACIVQLKDLCEQNNWSLVACHVETTEVSRGRKLFRRLLTVVSKLEEDLTRAKALVRPAIQPFPMQSLLQHCASENGQTVLEWDRCSPESRTPARQFYPQIIEYEDLVHRFGRVDRGLRPVDMPVSLQRKVDLFDYFDNGADRAINPFAHFRHAVDDMMPIFRADASPAVEDHVSQSHSVAGTPSASRMIRTTSQSSQRGTETPKKLLIHPYNGSPYTPSSRRSSSSNTAMALTPTRRPSALVADDEEQLETLRSDLAVLFRALLVARGIDTKSGKEVIASNLITSDTFNKPVIDRLLANPTFHERYGALGEDIDDSLPESRDQAKYVRKRLQEDTSDVFCTILESRGIDLATDGKRVVEQLKGKLIPAEVVERVLANSLVKAKQGRKRKADEEKEKAIKEEMAMERERNERRKRKRVETGGGA